MTKKPGTGGLSECVVNGHRDGWMDRRMDGQTDGWMGGWMESPSVRLTDLKKHNVQVIFSLPLFGQISGL